jgi:hypothetical protein
MSKENLKRINLVILNQKKWFKFSIEENASG